MIEIASRHKRGLTLANPVMNAAGALGFALEYRGLVDFSRLGAFVTNPLTLTPRQPARGPNLAPGPSGVVIHTGLPNPGVKRAVQRWGRAWERLGPPVIVHLAATTAADVRRAVEYLERSGGVSAIELGLRDDVRPDEMSSLVRAARGGLPLLVRLPLTEAAALRDTAIEAGADALTVGAPPRAALPPPESQARADIANPQTAATGRWYGPAVFEAALQAVTALRGSSVPVVGAGGVFSLENARAMLAAGAAAVQIDAAIWQRPGILEEFVTALTV